MANVIAVGIQWGDEGKGKVIDLLSPYMDVVARFQGGPNAGHTLVIGDKKTILHHIPSGILHDGIVSMIGNGAIIDPETILDEMQALEASGVPVSERLKISDRCQLIMPYHRALDMAREKAKGKTRIGTTGKGIGPAYEDKAARRGIRLTDIQGENFKVRLESILEYQNFLLETYFKVEPVTLDACEVVVEKARKHLIPLMADVPVLLDQFQRKNAAILFEGAQGSLLDVDHGTYPFVTSSNTVAGAALAGLGVGPQNIDTVLGIAKAYTTRVGSGPFPTELDDADGKRLADVGKEFGSTTGRARRTGWFDGVVVRHAKRINGITGLAITKLDVLDGFEEIKLCTGYRFQDEVIDYIPADSADLEACEPIYEVFPGWSDSTYGLTHVDSLPPNARRFLDAIESYCETPVVLLSTGPDRSHICWVKPFLGR